MGSPSHSNRGFILGKSSNWSSNSKYSFFLKGKYGIRWSQSHYISSGLTCEYFTLYHLCNWYILNWPSPGQKTEAHNAFCMYTDCRTGIRGLGDNLKHSSECCISMQRPVPLIPPESRARQVLQQKWTKIVTTNTSIYIHLLFLWTYAQERFMISTLPKDISFDVEK